METGVNGEDGVHSEVRFEKILYERVPTVFPSGFRLPAIPEHEKFETARTLMTMAQSTLSKLLPFWTNRVLIAVLLFPILKAWLRNQALRLDILC